MSQEIEARKQILQDCHRLVIKAGTRLVVSQESIAELVRQIAGLKQTGCQVILVSSGAVGMGMRTVGLKKRPHHLSKIQALAAVGQARLMGLYEEECAKHGFYASQLLLTADDMRVRERHLNTMNCIEALLQDGILPIINENDPISANELMKFGDNDSLAAHLGSMCRADLTIILTTVDGLYQVKEDGGFGERISVVHGMTQELKKNAKGTDDSSMSIGGMSSKLKAAELLNSAGDALWIADGNMPNILERILNAEDVGTLFLPQHSNPHKLDSKKRWLAAEARTCGFLYVDDGAAQAMRKYGASLLPSGLISAEGDFGRGDVVGIIQSSTGELFARGTSNFNREDTLKISRHRTDELFRILGYDSEEEVVHRNNLVIIPS